LNLDHRPLILHVIHHLYIGGMENGLVNLLNYLPESKLRHVIVCVEDSSDFRSRIKRTDVEVIDLHRSRIGLWSMRLQLFRLCRTLKPAILHSRNLSGLDAILPARLAGVRYCIHGEHGRDVDDLDGNNRKLALLRALHRFFIDRYITVSKDLRQYLIAKVGVQPKRISQIYNGVDTERFAPVAAKPEHILPLHFMGTEKIVIGTVGRLQEVKDQASLLKAYALLLANAPDLAAQVYLAIVGGGPLLETLRHLADELGIADRVWLPGSAENVPDILKSFDLFVLPSLGEGISNTILEAMATGLPVIATQVGGNPELVVDGETGSLVPAADPVTLAAKFQDYLADKEKMRQHGRNGRQRIEQEFSLSAMVGRYQSVYDSFLNEE